MHHEDGYTRTVFDDGGEVRADHAPQPGQDETAAQYGLAVEAMNRTHDLAHTILAATLGLPASPTLSAVAGGAEHWPHWWREEQAVLALQGYAAAVGVDLEAVANRMTGHGPPACIGITAEALTVTVGGRPPLVIPRDQMLDLMVRIGLALREPVGASSAPASRANVALRSESSGDGREPASRPVADLLLPVRAPCDGEAGE